MIKNYTNTNKTKHKPIKSNQKYKTLNNPHKN